MTEKKLVTAVNIPYRAQLVIDDYHRIEEVILYTSKGTKVPLGVTPAQLRHILMELPMLSRKKWVISPFTLVLPERMRKTLKVPSTDRLIKLSLIEEARGNDAVMFLFSLEQLLEGLPSELEE